MTTRRKRFLDATTIVAALLCFSMTIFGLVAIHLAAAAEVNAPVSAGTGQLTPQEISLLSSSPAATQSTATIADPQSNTPVISLVPFQLTIANHMVSEPTSLSALAMGGTRQSGGAPGAAASAVTTSGNAAPSAASGSLVPIAVSALGSGSGLILVSYGTAIVVLGVMRYWSFSFDDGAESSSAPGQTSGELNNANVVYVRGSAYLRLENVEYGRAGRH